LELLAGRRAWELANEGAPKKGKRRKKTAPTLTKNTVSGGAAKKKASKSASGIGVIE
jgi:DNA topoisomerase-1